MGPVEAASGDRAAAVFGGLAASRGVSVRMCVAAARIGRLGDVVGLPVVEGYRRPGTLSSAQAVLARRESP